MNDRYNEMMDDLFSIPNLVYYVSSGLLLYWILGR